MMVKSPRLFTINAEHDFLDALASQLLLETKDDPLALGRYTILLPTRRACRTLGETLLSVMEGKSLILPNLQPMGEIDEDQIIFDEALGAENLNVLPTITGVRRQLLLTRLVRTWITNDQDSSLDQAARLANELGRLLDQVQTERVSFNALASLVPEDYSKHWQETLDFLKILTNHWPKILADNGAVDPAERRNLLLKGLAMAWKENEPMDPVVAAGSTGSIPATADLLAVVATLPTGRVVLPGLQLGISDREWEAVSKQPTHPQYGMARLLVHLGVAPDEVKEWPSKGRVTSNDRAQLVAEMMRPYETSDAWGAIQSLPSRSLKLLERIDCKDEVEEAAVLALRLRYALETPNKKAALITPDRRLARRVAAELKRWNIKIDDSAGQPLNNTPPGTFLRLISLVAMTSFSSVALLALLKHPMTSGGMVSGMFRAKVRSLERLVLRGSRPSRGIDGLRAVVLEREEAGQIEAVQVVELNELLNQIERCIGPLSELMAGGVVSTSKLVDAHLKSAETLSKDVEKVDATQLWAGEAGEALASFFSDLRESVDVLPNIDGAAYVTLLDLLMATQVVRPKFGGHPRLNIWGPLEARLQHADLIILGGLNEGTWPAEPRTDPWLSRPMRDVFGLTTPERRIGLSAHDFAQAFCVDEVVLSRSRKVDGTPTVQSRWLTRLETVLAGAGIEQDDLNSKSWLSQLRALNQPPAIRRIEAPAPRPPLNARPRKLSVTQIETWMRDPYSIYARHVLRLLPIAPLEADPGAAERGIFIHQALETFVNETPEGSFDKSLARLLVLGKRAFGEALVVPAVNAFWWPRFQRIAAWFIRQERSRKVDIAKSFPEIWGKLEIDAPAGPFILTATADRIDVGNNGQHTIIDYKSGSLPTDKEVVLGFAPQLPLEAAIAMAGGFSGVSIGASIGVLAYWRMSGGNPAGEEHTFVDNVEELAIESLEGLKRLIAIYDKETTPYVAVPNPVRGMRHSDYHHLSRVQEWSPKEARDKSS